MHGRGRGGERDEFDYPHTLGDEQARTESEGIGEGGVVGATPKTERYGAFPSRRTHQKKGEKKRRRAHRYK